MGSNLGNSALTWILGVSTVLAYALPMLARSMGEVPARLALLLAWSLHGACLLVSLLGLGEGPRFGFGPALSVMAWLVLTVYALESRLYPQLQARRALSGLGAMAALLGLVFPGSTLAKASAWLPLHLTLGVASYGLFAAAVVHAWLMTRAEAQMRQGMQVDSGLPLMTLERLMFGFVGAGFVLLSATLLAGWFFGEALYGAAHGAASGWKWNHKTIFSVLSWTIFAVLLIGRWRIGWRGRRAVQVLYAGAGMLLLAYVGSRFVLEVILHRTV